MEPLETFRDDPLRVLRCVRFASRFGFQMSPNIEHAARDPDIHVCYLIHSFADDNRLHTLQNALITKISRERVGEELDKMMKGAFKFRGSNWNLH